MDAAQEGEFKVYGNAMNISVAWVVSHRSVGIVNADLVWPEIGRWWLARVNILDASKRSKGIGTKMIELLKEELRGRMTVTHMSSAPLFKELLVAPGGYGSDIAKQINFYTKNGFKPCGEDGFLWQPESA